MIGILVERNSTNARVYTADQWMSIIEGARRHKPFNTVLATQSVFNDYTIFKKTVKNKNRSLNIQKARVIEYSLHHASEVWVKYTASGEEEWSTFAPLKKHARASLPPPEQNKYDGLLPVKASKAADVQRIVD